MLYIGLVIVAATLAACGGDDGDGVLASGVPAVGGPSNTGSTPAAEDDGDAGQAPPPTVAPPPVGPLVNDFSLQVAAQPFAASQRSLDTFPLDQIVSGGVPKDGIPALTNPPAAAGASFLGADDIVLGVVINGAAKAYPHNIGWWHEIVNDRVGGHPVSVTFCPLTGTGLVFDARDDNGGQFELGVSGLLFNNNLVMYDRRDDRSLYPQLYFTAVDGPRRGQSLTLLPVVETRWATWKRLHPDSQVVSGGTYSRSRYTSYPYGDYRTNNSYLLFGLSPSLGANPNPAANTFGTKDRVVGVRLNGEAKAYPMRSMGPRAVVNDRVGGVDIAVVWDEDAFLAVPYARQVNGQVLHFEIDQGGGGFPFSLRDQETGTLWDANGVALEGPLAGSRLVQVPAHNSMWFAWVTFWQDTAVWQP